jgi:hypothetical protein
MATTQDIYSMTDTWNAGGTTFDAIKMNVTDTASAAGSLLANLQVGGTSRFSVAKGGNITAGTASNTLVIANISASAIAFNCFGNNRGCVVDGTAEGFRVQSAGSLSWSSDGSVNGTPDLAFSRNAAGIPEINSGTPGAANGIVPGVRFATTQVVTSLLNNSSAAQNVFAAANDVLTLAAATTYFFDCLYFINTGTTTHTTATGFVASSAFTSINYLAELWSTTAGTISTTAPSVLDVNVSTATVLNATSVAPRTTIRCNGIIRTNLASTITPQITFSAGPTGTCEVAVNSFFRIWPVGSNTVAAVGGWA